jgi:hypothetical protein
MFTVEWVLTRDPPGREIVGQTASPYRDLARTLAWARMQWLMQRPRRRDGPVNGFAIRRTADDAEVLFWDFQA